MKQRRFYRLVRSVYRSATTRLALSYLLIIMLMSIGFSFVFYRTSYHELGRQVPPPAIRAIDQAEDQDGPASNNTGATGDNTATSTNSAVNNTAQPYHAPHDEFARDPAVRAFLEKRVAEARHNLLLKLIYLNLAAVVIGGMLSYVLARRTLLPIEANMQAQLQFVSDASHELRTPLTSLKTINEVAIRRPNLSSASAKELFAENVEEISRLQELTDGLLQLARPDSVPLAMAPVSLQEIASDAMNRIIRPAQSKNITVDDTVPSIQVFGNRQALVQVLTILLDNAIKYSPANSTISLSGEQKGKNGIVHIKDTGIGIEPKDLPHIFERFYRADKSRSEQQRESASGYGIGLSIAHKIIHRHHGTISVTSELGKGSTFSIQLPLAKA